MTQQASEQQQPLSLRQRIRPNIFWAMTLLAILALTGVGAGLLLQDKDIVISVLGAAFTSIGMMAMRILEKE